MEMGLEKIDKAIRKERGWGYLSCSILCGYTKYLTLDNLKRKKTFWLMTLVSRVSVSQKRAEKEMATDKEARDHGGGSLLFVGQFFSWDLPTPN